MNNARIMLLPEWMGRKQWAMVRARRQTFQGPRSKRWLRALSSQCEGSSAIFCASPASEECGYQRREVREIFSQKYEQHKLFPRKTFEGNEGGNRQNRLHLESRIPSWAGLWTLSYMPSIYGNDISTGKPGALDGRAPAFVPRLSVA